MPRIAEFPPGSTVRYSWCDKVVRVEKQHDGATTIREVDREVSFETAGGKRVEFTGAGRSYRISNTAKVEPVE